MNILLDENIPVQLSAIFTEHVVKSVNDKDIGWKGIKNGLLLTAMVGRFDLLITADRNMYAQQNLAGRPLSMLVDLIVRTAGNMTHGQYVVLDDVSG